MRKALGVPSQDDTSADPSALGLAEEEVGQTLYPIHRIDRPASGLLLFAATPRDAATLTRALREGEILRTYWAIVSGHPEPRAGRLEDLLRHDRRRNKSYRHPSGKRAALSYQVRATGTRYTLVEVWLETGRHHQIRAQLATRGWPVRGDLKYGARRSQPGGGISLHAVALSFPHPRTGERISYTAEPPEDTLWDTLAAGISPAGETATP